MSVNRQLPHVLVLPEDDANRQIALGFQLDLDWSVQRQIQVLKPAGGWTRVVETFESDHVGALKRNPHQFLVLLIDFDDDLSRLAYAKNRIPPAMLDRAFILGSLTQPESLKAAGLGSYEQIGSKMALDCREQNNATWSHELLHHNASELDRLCQHVRTILF